MVHPKIHSFFKKNRLYPPFTLWNCEANLQKGVGKSPEKDQFLSPESRGATLFKERCSQYHGLPDPGRYTAKEWPAIVEKMRGYMRVTDKKVITKDEEKEVEGYLERNAGDRIKSTKEVKMRNTFLRYLILLLVFFFVPQQAFSQWRDYGQGPGPGMMGWGYGMGWFGMMLMAFFWVAVIIGIIFLIKWLFVSTGGKGHGAISEDSPLEILKRRYARGEINKEEFEAKKKDLGY